MLRRPILALPLLLLPLTACAPGAADAPALDHRPALSAGFSAVAGGPAWIEFADKGPATAADLAATEAALHPNAVRRRARNRTDGAAVDARDLPLHGAYLDALEDLGLTLRVQVPRLNAVSVQAVGPDEAAALAALPFVRSVRPVALRSLPMLPTVTDGLPDAPRGDSDPGPSPFDYGPAAWHAELTAADDLHGQGLTGAGVIVGVADTGFRLTHEVLEPLQAQVLDAYDFLEDDAVVANETPEEDTAEQDFHGSAVVSVLAGKLDGTMVGIAPDISLLLAKTESVPLEEPFEEDTWIAGVQWAEANGADLVTSSLAWADWYTFPEDLDGATAVSTVFADQITADTGILLVQSAGNDGPGVSSIWAPNDAASVLSAAAVDDSGDVAFFSSRGPTADGRFKPDLAAPGQSTTIVRWDEATGLQTASGTSFAAPILAGVAALLIEAHPDWTRDEIVAAFKDTASQAATPDNDLGWGIVNAYAACGPDDDGDGAIDVACGGDDCVDDDATRGPGQPEQCNELDDDCDGAPGADEVDSDGDGDLACATDCDDSDPTLNGLDADGDTNSPCDGDCDDNDVALHALDGDGDGDTLCGTDCDDADPTVEGLDHDGDGASLCDGDCADGDASQSPLLEEIPYDGIDQDCDGIDPTDVDGDGFDGLGAGGIDCADDDPSIFPDPLPEGALTVAIEGGHELCFDARDNDCDGLEGTDDPDCNHDTLDEAGAITAAAIEADSVDNVCTFSVAGRAGPGVGVLLLLLPLLALRRRS
ncbi:MAG: S8 family serine peptidase [Proteobacteria bacterium]|nr:S8 family serine peptidase [Pseudomonadota bacterium]